ncbi:MAG: recombinase family protein [Paracoccaceae bacterium]|nr:recombinase family protein [Paracoccaceae bacterium]
MSRAFAYTRISAAGQETENLVREIHDAGFSIAPHRIIAETVSGSTAMARRKGTLCLLDRMERGDLLVVTKLDRMERGDLLVVTKLDRLGWDAIEVSMTVEN